MAGFIEWVPIEDMPEALKDGRDLLVWYMGDPLVVLWRNGEWWQDGHPAEIEPTYVAEINEPGEPK
jgi:hypothetical protein